VITVSDLIFYPLKGARGIATPSLELDRFGPRFDRRWMAITEAGRFLTQREAPELCLVEAIPTAEALTLRAPGQPELAVPIQADDETRRVRVWTSECDAHDQGERAAGWLSAFLQRPARLVHLPDDRARRTDPAFDPTGSPVSFADGYPILLIGEASLVVLNGSLVEPVPMDRFRPNLVVSGSAPYAEDDWRRFTIGGLPFEGVKRCARCVVTTVDQQSATRHDEPLRTLSKLRRGDHGALFGMNVVHRARGTIAVGDVVEVG